MYIGILFEGKNDIGVLKIITSRIAKSISKKIKISFIESSAGGSIINKADRSCSLFFKSKPYCDLAIFVGDMDKDKGKCNKIRKKAREYSGKYNIVIGCPDPTLEQWFFAEENAIKKVFNLNGSKPLPFNELHHPKDRIKKIMDEFDCDITKLPRHRYCDIAKILSLEMLKNKDKSYQKFHSCLLREIKTQLNMG